MTSMCTLAQGSLPPRPSCRKGTGCRSLSFALGLAIFCGSLFQLALANAASSSLTLTSSNRYLVTAFNWNKAKALSWVRTGVKSGYIPCYWGGYNYREAFYNYGKNDYAWHWLKRLMDSHYEYPEVSFTAIGAVATGLMGIAPDAPNHQVTTLGRLPPDVDWVELNHVPVGAHDVLVRHERANTITTVRHNAGKATLHWEARFPGGFSKLLVNGVARKAKQKTDHGITVSLVQVTLEPGQQATVAAGLPAK
jgi:hypothetical protein